MSKSNTTLLVEAGLAYRWKFHRGGPGVRSLKTGRPHDFLKEMCHRHARYQASHLTQGHQRWDSRKDEILAYLPKGYTCEENAAESWPWNNRFEAATEMFHSWEQSPGHWAMCNHRAVFYGIDMAKGNNGIYYAAMLVAWKGK